MHLHPLSTLWTFGSLSMENDKTKFYKSLTALAIVGSVLIGAMIVTEIKSYRFIGGGVAATNTISVSGSGEVYAPPDIATVSFTVREESKKVADAQDKVNTKVKAALALVRKVGILDKDIKTQNYNSYPKYEWEEGTFACLAVGCPPPRPGRQVLTGYEVSQSVTVTIRNLDSVSAVVDGLGTASVTDMQGPNFAVDKQDDKKAEARKQAIDKARAKAEVLAGDLGVSLVRIVSFSEGENYQFYARPTAAFEKASAGDASSTELPQGEEKIVSNVTVTYEIR